MTKTEVTKELVDKLAIFVKTPSKRCVRTIGESDVLNCKYSGKTLGLDTEGCIIGLFLSEEDRLKADQVDIDGVYDLVDMARKHNITIPTWFREYECLLVDFQCLHDEDINWKKTGLSAHGKRELNHIITDHKLDGDLFKQFLT